jgi:hypothetical protein
MLASVFSAVARDADSIAGEWVSVDPHTRGITRVIIAQDGAGWAVQAFGRCHPRDCDWRSVPVVPLGEAVEDNSFRQGFAVWKPGFATKYVTFTLREERLVADIVTVFHDCSGRANFRRTEVLKRRDEGR